jgi:hypothetical protein
MKSILSVLRKFIAVIGAVAMMITFMTTIIPTQSAAAQSAEVQSEVQPAAAQSAEVQSAEVQPAGAAAVAGKVAIRLAVSAIGNALSGSRRSGTQYLIRIDNETNFPVTFQSVCEVRNGYWPLLSQPIEPGITSYGFTAGSEFQFAGVYRTEIPNSNVRSLVFGAFRTQPRLSSSIKRDLIDSVISLDCGRYSNRNNAPWGDSRDNNRSPRNVDTTPGIRLVRRHLKMTFPPATNEVTVYEFRITNS